MSVRVSTPFMPSCIRSSSKTRSGRTFPDLKCSRHESAFDTQTNLIPFISNHEAKLFWATCSSSTLRTIGDLSVRRGCRSSTDADRPSDPRSSRRLAGRSALASLFASDSDKAASEPSPIEASRSSLSGSSGIDRRRWTAVGGAAATAVGGAATVPGFSWPAAPPGFISKGKDTWNCEPLPFSLSTVRVPPCLIATSRQMERPRPSPSKCRVEDWSSCSKGWKMRSSFSAAIPMPVSSTVTVTVSATWSAVAKTRTCPFAVNFRALVTRL
mmetsp:Transcript_54421/g.141769  ORF Transcript_54421/g.141769 Transcript_54421/m.141769 type:complete len:270 (-) Transcript_54421:884-1693(-)